MVGTEEPPALVNVGQSRSCRNSLGASEAPARPGGFSSLGHIHPGQRRPATRRRSGRTPEPTTSLSGAPCASAVRQEVSLVAQLRDWLKRTGRTEGGGVWSEEDIVRLRDCLKQGRSLSDIATHLARSPQEVAAKIAEFRPVRMSGRYSRPAPADSVVPPKAGRSRARPSGSDRGSDTS